MDVDNSLPSKIFAKLGTAILIVALLDLAFVNWVIIKDQKAQSGQSSSEREIPDLVSSETSSSEEISSASPSPQAESEPKEVGAQEPKTVIQKETQTIVQTAQKEIFVPMGSGSTTSDTYKNLDGTDVTIDTAKYGQIDSVIFEASIWVVGGNGRAWARVINVSDNNPYIESVISNNVSTPTVMTSAKIPIHSGSKTYRIQAKTDITNFAAHVDNARLKITLK